MSTLCKLLALVCHATWLSWVVGAAAETMEMPIGIFGFNPGHWGTLPHGLPLLGFAPGTPAELLILPFLAMATCALYFLGRELSPTVRVR